VPHFFETQCIILITFFCMALMGATGNVEKARNPQFCGRIFSLVLCLILANTYPCCFGLLSVFEVNNFQL